MKKAKHTPGPWVVSETKHPTHGFWSVLGGRGEISLGPIHEKADADLIAAAPEMLVALRKVVLDPESAETTRAVFAAFAKAKGKQV